MRLTTLALLAVLAVAGAQAKTLRWASQGDYQTADPYSQNELLTNLFAQQVHDTLVMRDKEMKIVPALAVSWTQVNPTTWRFNLRKGVKFHDGAPFSADDAVFSIERALDKASQRKNQMLGITAAKKLDALTKCRD